MIYTFYRPKMFFAWVALLVLVSVLVWEVRTCDAAEPGEVVPVDAATQPRTRTSYSVPLFPAGSVLRNPNSGVLAYFQLYPDTKISGEAILDLWYSYSPIVIPDISTITVSINGTPLTSRILKLDQAAKSNWKIAIPSAHFRPGMNDIEVSVVHRTIDGLCRDIDNDANWFTINPETRLVFLLEKPDGKLADFPRPFTDYYTAGMINTAVYLPENFDNGLLAALMNLGGVLGRGSQAGALPTRLLVRTGAPGRYEANEIVFGMRSGIPETLTPEAGKPAISFVKQDNGFKRLHIDATDADGYEKAVEALGRPLLVGTLQNDSIKLGAPLPAMRYASSNPFMRGSREFFTLTDFGFDSDIQVSGAFHQEAQMFIPSPPNYRAAEGSYIELNFRHSPLLDPRKSAVTIYINAIPIRAVALMHENAAGGVLRAAIPTSELGSSFWNVRFAFYHDLGIIDCSKRYDDVAWSVIDKKTSVYLKKSKTLRHPALEDFPNDFQIDDSGVAHLTLLLMEHPGEADLTAIFKLAYFIGLNNNGKIAWHVETPETFDAANAKGTVIAVGRNHEGNKWGILKTNLLLYPENGAYYTDDRLEILPDVLKDFTVCQVTKTADNKRVYALMYKTTHKFIELLDFSIAAASPLTGQVALVDDKGEVTSLRLEATETVRDITFIDRLTASIGGAAVTYALVLAVVILATAVLLVATRKK